MESTPLPAPQTVPLNRVLFPAGAALSAGVFGLALSRLLFEALFPHALWLGHPAGAAVFALLLAGGGLILWRRLLTHFNTPTAALAPFLPLWLNLYYLLYPAVNLTLSRVLFAGSLWLGGVLFYRLRWGKRGLVVWLWIALLPLYLLTMSHTVGTADTFEFQVVIPRLGIVHPTGYPLYMLLGRLFTLLPLDSVAWRLNLASAIFALGAVSLVYLLGEKLSGRALSALLAALLLGLLPTFWSQAVQAEVYALHALFVAASLYLITALLAPARFPRLSPDRTAILLALVLGLGLTHHLTMVFLLPPAGLALFFHWRRHRPTTRHLLWLALAFFLPLLLYAYLPWRWSVVNNEPMGLSRFLDWVAGRRFQGALRLDAWYQDLDRYPILGRLFLTEWMPWPLLLFIPAGLIAAWKEHWRIILAFLFAWLGFTFYSLNYYVADLAVFLIPAYLVMTLFWGLGVAWLVNLVDRFTPARAPLFHSLLFTLIMAPLLIHTGEIRFPAQDRSTADGRTTWAAGVLAGDLDPNAAILADSANFPPLYYLQQAEGTRPDLAIMILPDEAAYRAELVQRLAQGQTVYLARFIPGLEGAYHLRAAGPLTEVASTPLTDIPAGTTPVDLSFAELRLSAFTRHPAGTFDPRAAAFTLYWQAEAPVSTPYHIYTRWVDEQGQQTPDNPAGQHPANNNYPTPAWQAGEIVPDFHLIPLPIISQPQALSLQVAVAPPFTTPNELAWQTVTTITAHPPENLPASQPVRVQLGPVALTSQNLPAQARPDTALPLHLTGYGLRPEDLVFTLRPAGSEPQPAQAFQESSLTNPPLDNPFVYATTISTNVPPGRYAVYGLHPTAPARCGWLAPLTEGCVLGEVEIAGTPLPAGAVNFADQIALLDIDLANTTLSPGGMLEVILSWQSLAPLAEDYTVFVQVLDAQDQIVGQVDSWPLQGTYPTSQWPVGEQVRDPYSVQLSAELPAGSYRLAVGWYLLENLQRLPVVDAYGNVVDDRIILSGLSVP